MTRTENGVETVSAFNVPGNPEVLTRTSAVNIEYQYQGVCTYADASQRTHRTNKITIMWRDSKPLIDWQAWVDNTPGGGYTISLLIPILLAVYSLSLIHI